MKGMTSPESESGSTNAIHIPTEIIDNIVSFVRLQKNSQSTLYSCCLVSRSWYSVAIAALYQSPVLKEKTYLRFARTICPPTNVEEIKRPFAEYVRTLDLLGLDMSLDFNKKYNKKAGQERRKTMEKLLVWVKGSLEVFIATQELNL
jgi:hypothetical protein